MALTFEWDEEKSKRNFRKHGVRFEEAKTVFNDPFAITIGDPDHSDEEERYLDIGLSSTGRVLVVWYTEREENIRIIGCRRVTPSERKTYEEREDGF
ncbi:MAG: BrnT family toxin [Pseudomonadota bacterium]